MLAFLNIVGHGMRGGKYRAGPGRNGGQAHGRDGPAPKDLIVGIKTAHYAGPGVGAGRRAVEAGKLAEIPVMVDFGSNRPERPLLRAAD